MDALGNIAEDFAGGLFGVTDKATIYVPNLGVIKTLTLAASATFKSPAELIGTTQTTAEELIRASAKEATSFIDLGGEEAKLAAETLRNATAETIDTLGIYNKVEVQYNPKTLSFSGIGGRIRGYTDALGGVAENGTYQVDNRVSTTLSCELVFTNVNISDAFMTEDVSNMNINAAAGMGANVVKRMLGRSPSVQPMVDGFLAVLTNNYTRQIIFAWGSTVFRGELIRVDCNYKMFNKRGDPIIATVNITVRQGQADNQNMSEKAWRKAVEKTFKEK